MNIQNFRFSPAYRGTLALVVTQQLLLGLLTGLMLSGGVLEAILFHTLVAFWVGFAMILVRRPHNPTKVDLFMIKWGTFLLFLLSLGMFILFTMFLNL